MFGAYIIGDEILVGKRQDKHFPFLIEALATRGLRLSWAQYLGDDPERLTAAFARSLASNDIVFSFGGIGATPDDHTRQCVAAAANAPLRLHPEAERELRARFGAEATPERLRMGEFPLGASVIPNPVNRVPGFSWASTTSCPDFRRWRGRWWNGCSTSATAQLFDRDRWSEASIFVYEAGESQLIAAMESVGALFPGVKVFSLPSMGNHGSRRHVELGVRGDPKVVGKAAEALRDCVRRAGFPFSETEKTTAT